MREPTNINYHESLSFKFKTDRQCIYNLLYRVAIAIHSAKLALLK